MDRRYFLRALFAAGGAAVLVPTLGAGDEASAAPRPAVKPEQAPEIAPDADVPAEGAQESQYFYYYRRPRYYYRPRYFYRPRYYYRPRYFYRPRYYRRYW